jgi:hypothetical protein
MFPLRPWARRVGPLAVGALVVLAAPRAHAESGMRVAFGFTFAAAIPDHTTKTQLGVPWFLRGEVRGLSRLDTTPTLGNRPAEGHFSIYDAFFVEGGVGALCSQKDCVSLGDVHLRGVGGYEALVGWRAPSASVYVGPRISWEGWITSKLALGTVSWPVVVRFDHAVRHTERRIFSAWASPHGAFRSYGGEWAEPVADGLWMTLGFATSRAVVEPWRDENTGRVVASDSQSPGALAATVSLGIRGGSPF